MKWNERRLLYKQKVLVQRDDKDSGGGKGFDSCLKLPIALNEEEHQNEESSLKIRIHLMAEKSEFLMG